MVEFPPVSRIVSTYHHFPVNMDNLTPEQRRKNMQRIRSVGTMPERIVMQELKRKKIYFASNVKNLPGKPDIVFRRKRVAVFIDSDFWHGHKTRFIMPKVNKAYWKVKIQRNQDRDRRVTRLLNGQGWKVLRFWEHNVKKKTNVVIEQIMQTLNGKI